MIAPRACPSPSARAQSGYDRFAGIEGLRGCCHVKSVAEDRFPLLMDTRIPPFMQYPVPASGFDFASSLIRMFYGVGFASKVRGLIGLLMVVMSPAGAKDKEKRT